MQHYILIKRMPKRARLSLGMIDDLAQEWEHRAKALRIRRQRILRQQARRVVFNQRDDAPCCVRDRKAFRYRI